MRPLKRQHMAFRGPAEGRIERFYAALADATPICFGAVAGADGTRTRRNALDDRHSGEAPPIRHHSLAREPVIDCGADLAAAQRLADEHFGDGFANHEIVIHGQRADSAPEVCATRRMGAKDWRVFDPATGEWIAGPQWAIAALVGGLGRAGS